MAKHTVRSKSLHHIALACKDPEATYAFYKKLGFDLVHCENHKQGKGYFRHFFFDMGQGDLLGFFHINNVGEKKDYSTRISVDLGMPVWVNHVAFRLDTMDEMEQMKARLKDAGVGPLIETDHGWGYSLYMVDPNGIMVEFTVTTSVEDFEQTEEQALALLRQPPEQIPDEERKEASDYAKVVA